MVVVVVIYVVDGIDLISPSGTREDDAFTFMVSNGATSKTAEMAIKVEPLDRYHVLFLWEQCSLNKNSQ